MRTKETFIEGLCNIFIEQGLMTPQRARDLQQAFKDSAAEQFDDFLIEEGILEERDLLDALSMYYQVPSFDVVDHFFDHVSLRKFPKDFLLQNGLIPLEDDENIMIMVASDPSNPDLVAEIGKYVSYDIQFYVGIKRRICNAVKEFYDESLTTPPPEDTIYDTPDTPAPIQKEELEEAEGLNEDL